MPSKEWERRNATTPAGSKQAPLPSSPQACSPPLLTSKPKAFLGSDLRKAHLDELRHDVLVHLIGDTLFRATLRRRCRSSRVTLPRWEASVSRAGAG